MSNRSNERGVSCVEVAVCLFFIALLIIALSVALSAGRGNDNAVIDIVNFVYNFFSNLIN